MLCTSSIFLLLILLKKRKSNKHVSTGGANRQLRMTDRVRRTSRPTVWSLRVHKDRYILTAFTGSA